MRLFDTHAHITDESYDQDRHEMLEQSFAEGVEYIMCPAVNMKTSEEAVAISNAYTQVYGAVGVHPLDVETMADGDIETYYAMAKANSKIRAIGEIGLDYYYSTDTKDLQIKAFVEHLHLARELDLPVLIHDRDAHGDIMDILRTEGKGVRGILHCYSGSYEVAKELMKRDFFISFAGPVAFPKSVKAKEVAEKIPMDYLLIETDSPYLTPPPFRGKRNSPAHVRYVAEEIARLKGMSAEEVAEITLENGKRCFSIK